jgi:hypothetical protein
MEQSSPFRFEFLRSRRKQLASREGLYATLFEAFLDALQEEVWSCRCRGLCGSGFDMLDGEYRG